MGIIDNVYYFSSNWHQVSMIKIQRQYILITQALEIGEIEEVIQHSSKVVTFLIFPLLNNTNLLFRLLLQTLTSD